MSDDCTDIVVRELGRLNAADLAQHLLPCRNDEVTIDLARLDFIEPVGLVAVAVVAERAHSSGRAVRFTGPDNIDRADYLARMRLAGAFDALGIEHALPPVHERRSGHRLVELHRFDDEDGLDELVDALIRTYVDDHPGLIQPLYAALDEIAVNVFEHSGRDHGFLAMQRFDGSNDIAFAIGDSGVGLRASLGASTRVPDDGVAIARAAQIHISSVDQPGRGRGIRRVIDVTGQHSGSVRLASGTAYGTFARGNPDPHLTGLRGPFPGTLADVRLSL